MESLLRLANHRQLAADPAWLALLHYRPDFIGRQRSLVDAPDFFLAPAGRTDPAAELEATLRAILAPPAGDPNLHAACRFPARREWLAEQLGIPPGLLPAAPCPLLDRVLDEVRPQAVSLVFPAAYMNSPASLFGHTLLAIRGEIDSELMNHSVSYAAFTTETNGLLFAVKGIVGAYPGRCSFLPYYRKVLEYNDMSQRDMWEYRLDLTPREARRLVLHVWEVRDAWADYYFFDENCAQFLLLLLDAARPGLDLAGQARPWVIPLDTVRLVVRAGLVEGVVYRPSKATQRRHLASAVPPADQLQARALSHGQSTPDELPPAADEAARARLLDLAVADLQIRYGYHQVSREAYVPRFRQLLLARSRLNPPDGYLAPVPTPPQPESGHGSARFGLGAGVDDGTAYTRLSLRPAYHDLLDPDPGYLNGSEIQFMGIELRWFEGARGLELHRLDAIVIRSLSPRDHFQKPISWKVETGLVREPADDEEVHRQAYLNTGGGFAWEPQPAMIAYTLFEADLRVGDIGDGYALGAGGSAGVLHAFGERWKYHLFGRAISYPAGDPHDLVELGLGARYAVSSATAIRLDLAWRHAYGETQPAAQLGWYVYF